nr:RdRp [signal crayfish associated tombus-like virus 3]
MMGEGAVITKGLNLVGVAGCLLQKWNSFKRPVVLGVDATAFDAHVSSPWLRWEHSIYNGIFGDPKLAELLTWQVDNRGKSFCPDGKLKYRVDGRRFSGDMNTGLGNCLIMCAMVYSYARHRGIEVKLANNGDDCLVFMESEDLEGFTGGMKEWFEELGFRLTAEPPAYNFEAIEFCQMHPVLIGDEWRMVRTPKIAFEKDTMCTLSVTDDEYLGWLAGVADCGLATASGVPVLQEFYLNLQVAAGGRVAPERLVEYTGMKHLSRGRLSRAVPVDESSRFSFWLAFGVDPDTQLAIERDLQRIRLVGPIDGFVPTHWPLDASTPSNYQKKQQ